MFNPVWDGFGDVFAVDEMACDLRDRAVHRGAVVPGDEFLTRVEDLNQGIVTSLIFPCVGLEDLEALVPAGVHHNPRRGTLPVGSGGECFHKLKNKKKKRLLLLTSWPILSVYWSAKGPNDSVPSFRSRTHLWEGGKARRRIG